MPFSFIKKLEGKELTDEKIRDFKRMRYSLMVLSGMDSPYSATGAINMASTIEALWDQWFVILIVGRLIMSDRN